MGGGNVDSGHVFMQERKSGLRFQREIFAYNMNKLKALGHVMLGGKFHQQHDRVLVEGTKLSSNN
jgi:hypothetical protein